MLIVSGVQVMLSMFVDQLVSPFTRNSAVPQVSTEVL